MDGVLGIVFFKKGRNQGMPESKSFHSLWIKPNFTERNGSCPQTLLFLKGVGRRQVEFPEAH